MITPTQRTELEAAAFRRLIRHLKENSDIQNIDLMIVADFCRNCLSKWYTTAAAEQDIDVNYEQAREAIYGMPYPDWKDAYQVPATPEQTAAFEKRKK